MVFHSYCSPHEARKSSRKKKPSASSSDHARKLGEQAFRSGVMEVWEGTIQQAWCVRINLAIESSIAEGAWALWGHDQPALVSTGAWSIDIYTFPCRTGQTLPDGLHLTLSCPSWAIQRAISPEVAPPAHKPARAGRVSPHRLRPVRAIWIDGLVHGSAMLFPNTLTQLTG